MAYYFPTAHRAQCARYQLQDIPREIPFPPLGRDQPNRNPIW